jgi:hypothetical protein
LGYKENDLMKEAAVVLDAFGWKADKFEQLFSLSKSLAFRLAKWAREKRNRPIAAQAIRAMREQEAQEAVRLRDEWQERQDDVAELQRGYSLGSNVRFRS